MITWNRCYCQHHNLDKNTLRLTQRLSKFSNVLKTSQLTPVFKLEVSYSLGSVSLFVNWGGMLLFLFKLLFDLVLYHQLLYREIVPLLEREGRGNFLMKPMDENISWWKNASGVYCALIICLGTTISLVQLPLTNFSFDQISYMKIR